MDRFEENIMISNGVLAEESLFWNNELSKEVAYPDFGDLSLKYKRQDTKNEPAFQYEFKFNDVLSKKLKNIAKSNTKGIYTLVLSGLFYTVSRFTLCQDMIIGTSFLNPSYDMENYINTILPIRITINEELNYKMFLQEVKDKYILAERNINFPYSKMCELGNTGRKELFEIFLSSGLQNEEAINCRLKMHLVVDKEIKIKVRYQKEYFTIPYIENFFQVFTNFYNVVIANPNINLKEIDLLSDEHRKMILEDFNNTIVSYENAESIYSMIEGQAKLNKDKIAINCDDINYTYGELMKRTRAFANYIKSKNLGQGEKLVILNRKSFDSVAIMLAVIYNRLVCVPVDRNYPIDRINFIINETEAGLIFYDDHKFDKRFGEKGINSESVKDSLENGEMLTRAAYEDPIFMIYTSGSTGRPKGVILNNSGILNHMYTKIRELDLKEQDVFCFNLNSSFVASIWQIFTPLILGAKVYIYDDEVNKNIYELLKKGSADKVSVLEIVPSMLLMYVQQIEEGIDTVEIDSLRNLVLTGEAVRGSLINKLFKIFPEKVEFVNAYGQSEASDDTLHYHIKRNVEYEGSVPIGHPANNTKVFVLNKEQNLQPIGAMGELCITGTGIVNSYFKREELTQEKFVDNPYLPGRKMFKTGDMVYWKGDGTIHYIGRTDHQLKIRGNRVELDEVENVLGDIDFIKESVVVVKENRGGTKELYAYVILNSEDSIEDVRKQLSTSLPEYMIPNKIIKIHKIPLLPNGKIDRKALLEFDYEGDLNNEEGVSTSLQNRLLHIWKKVLELEKISINDNFFSIGGDSLKAVTIVTILNNEGYNIRYNTLIKYPTIKMLEKYLVVLENEDKSIEQLKNEIRNRYLTDVEIVKNKKKEVIYYVEEVQWFWKNVKELRTIIPKKLSPDYVIPKINRTAEFLQLEEDLLIEEISRIVFELGQKGMQFENMLISNKVDHKFAASPIQQLTADLSGHMTGMILPIRELVTYDEMNEALRKLIIENQLFHAVIEKEKNSLTWKELSCEKIGDVPYLDLTFFSEDVKTKVLKELIEEWYHKVYYAEGKLLYRFFIVRLQANSLLLIAPIDHILFDGMSSEVIIQSLNENLLGVNNQYGTGKKDYEDYVLKIKEGPKNVELNDFINIFRLKEFYNNNLIIGNQLLGRQSKECSEMEVKIAINMNGNVDKLLELSLRITYLICIETFGVSDVPIKMFSYGREYQEKNYYNVVGYFTDFIPVILSTDDGREEFIRIKFLLDYIKQHNINFTALGLNDKWCEIAEKISMSERKFSENLILYNFQGKREGYDAVKMYYSLGKEQFNQFRLESSGFSIISYYTDEALYVDVLSKINLDKDKIKNSILARANSYFQNAEEDLVIK